MHRPYSASEAHRLLVESRPVEDGVAMVKLQGEADLHTAPILRDALNDAIESKPETLIVDLTGVTFIDSMMLGVLLSATRRARPNGTELRIVVDDPHVRRIFELTLLDHVMKLYPSVEIALESAQANEPQATEVTAVRRVAATATNFGRGWPLPDPIATLRAHDGHDLPHRSRSGLRGAGVIALVLGGLGSRLDLPVDRIDELALAAATLAPSVQADALQLEADVLDDRLVVRIGPLEDGTDGRCGAAPRRRRPRRRRRRSPQGRPRMARARAHPQ